jgi:hypothetical protein
VACHHVNGTIMVDLNHSHEHSTFGNWFHLNLAKTIEDMIFCITCPTTLFFFW